MNSLEFGRRLRNQREAEGRSQDQVAGAAGCSRGTISLWESGTPKRIDAQTLLRAARYLNTTVDYLLDGENAISEPSQHYGPPPSALASDWSWLTAEQRESIQNDARALAEHNRRIYEQLSAERDISRS